MLPPFAMRYVLLGLEGTPQVVETLLHALPADDPRWNARPDPERFTLREIVAHLADWEPIFLGRIERIRDEDMPFLPDVDEGKIAIENDYAHSDPHASFARFRRGRAAMLTALSALPPTAWEREGNRDPIGILTLENLAVLILGHDTYHTRQIAEWLKS